MPRLVFWSHLPIRCILDSSSPPTLVVKKFVNTRGGYVCVCFLEGREGLPPPLAEGKEEEKKKRGSSKQKQLRLAISKMQFNP